MKISWTKPYCGISYPNGLPKGHHISVTEIGSKAEATWLNFNVGGWGKPAGKFYGSLAEAKQQAEKWVKALLG